MRAHYTGNSRASSRRTVPLQVLLAKNKTSMKVNPKRMGTIYAANSLFSVVGKAHIWRNSQLDALTGLQVYYTQVQKRR